MGTNSKIEWTDATWNPIRGCSRVSEGCTNCYAEHMAARYSKPGMPYHGIARTTESGARWTGQVSIIEHMIDQPIRWKKPKMIFVNSMSDLFHEKLKREFIVDLFSIMNQANHHTYQILTKRAERLARLNYCLDWQEHIWMGVSIEDQKTTWRIENLRFTDAKVKFLSIEPLIDEITDLDLTDIDWVIVGGESGYKARIMEEDWALRIVSQCQTENVPVFVKQMGTAWAKEKGIRNDSKGKDQEHWNPDLRINKMPKGAHLQ